MEKENIFIDAAKWLELKSALISFFLKWWAYCFYIMIGILAKFSVDMVKGNKITFGQALGTTGISIFIGFLSSIVCMKYNPDNAGIIVPISTLMADKIITYLMTRDYKNLRDYLTNWTKK